MLDGGRQSCKNLTTFAIKPQLWQEISCKIIPITTTVARPTLNSGRTKQKRQCSDSYVLKDRRSHEAALVAERFFVAVLAAGKSSRAAKKNQQGKLLNSEINFHQIIFYSTVGLPLD